MPQIGWLEAVLNYPLQGARQCGIGARPQISTAGRGWAGLRGVRKLRNVEWISCSPVGCGRPRAAPCKLLVWLSERESLYEDRGFKFCKRLYSFQSGSVSLMDTDFLSRQEALQMERSVQWKTLIFDTKKGALNNANTNRIALQIKISK